MMTAMRTIIDLPVEQLEALDALCRREGISRAEGVRRAVADHVRTHQPSTRARAFGLWKAHRPDGLAYQRRLRREWDR
jgi:metal-responsive CopG/Arc/MetJ family transcriptional regulator